MSLVPCRECGHQVSNQAVACPECGCPRLVGNLCSACSSPLPSRASRVCPQCGHPVSLATGASESSTERSPANSRSLEAIGLEHLDQMPAAFELVGINPVRSRIRQMFSPDDPGGTAQFNLLSRERAQLFYSAVGKHPRTYNNIWKLEFNRYEESGHAIYLRCMRNIGDGGIYNSIWLYSKAILYSISSESEENGIWSLMGALEFSIKDLLGRYAHRLSL
jgi:hypothetical protein